MLRFLPNIITLCNLVSGAVACYFASLGFPVHAALFILLGAFLDFFDGLAARMIGVSGEMGKQLDSLADVVSFGVAPALLAVYLAEATPLAQMGGWPTFPAVAFFPLVMAAFSAYRLAKFNLDTRQSDQFIGLPTPANALFWLSLPLIQIQLERDWLWTYSSRFLAVAYEQLFLSPVALLFLALLLSVLLVAEIPLLALKFKDLRWKKNEWRWSLVVGAIALFTLFGFMGIPIVLLLYIVLSLISNTTRQHALQSRN
jgi:CDP-diacylglycerol--serine O-phosphatidyltransferase